MVEIMICPICKTGLNQSVTGRAGGVFEINCPNCGEYQLADQFHKDYIHTGKLDGAKLATLSYAIRRMQGHGARPFLVADLANDILRNTRLPSAGEQLDNLVLFLGQTLDEPGQKLDLFPETMRAVLGARTKEATTWALEQSLKRGLIQGVIKPVRVTQETGVEGATLSIDGWQRFSALQTAAAGSRRAFMAMQYRDPELDKVFFEYFKPAAKRAGYDLVKLDEEPRAGLIDDRLRLEIRTARFLVADLTHGNKGAYWEAGYAEGLGRPVIYTCKQSVFSSKDPSVRPHFDTNHYLIVPWDPADLRKAGDQLTTTIRVTLPTEARLSDD